jgi:hypothetical protein
MAQATTLSLDHTFSVAAGQTFTFDILGEGVLPQTADESIVLDVPVSTMNTLLTYSSSWAEEPGTSGASGYQPLPAVVLRLKTVVGSWLDALADGLTGATAGASYAASSDRLVVAGDGGSSVNSLVYHFQSIGGFTYHDEAALDPSAETDYLSLIPTEAISRFQTSALTTTPLSDVTGDLVAIPSEGVTGTEPGLEGAVQSLFEQAAAQGMVQKGTSGPDLQVEPVSHPTYTTLGSVEASTAVPAAGVYGVKWQVDQSLGLFVRYDLSKDRKYVLSNVNGTTGSTEITTISFGGVEFDLAGEVERSTPVPKTYQIVLRTVADGPI